MGRRGASESFEGARCGGGELLQGTVVLESFVGWDLRFGGGILL